MLAATRLSGRDDLSVLSTTTRITITWQHQDRQGAHKRLEFSMGATSQTASPHLTTCRGWICGTQVLTGGDDIVALPGPPRSWLASVLKR